MHPALRAIYDYDVAGNLISESEADGTPLRDIVYLNGERVAMRLYGSQAGWYYFVNDHLGTPQKIVDSSGVVVWQAAYLPFGKAQVLAGSTIVNNFRFPGQYYDAETELHYNWHRYYMPAKGRYLTPDPIGLAAGINLYAYVMGNPANLTDPDGLSVLAGVEGGATIGGSVGGPPGAIIGGIIGGVAGLVIGQWIWDNWIDGNKDKNAPCLQAKKGKKGKKGKSKLGSKPKNCPTGTKPIDESGMSRDDIHRIKKGVDAGPQDWTGISPDGDVITSGPDGEMINNGPFKDYLP